MLSLVSLLQSPQHAFQTFQLPNSTLLLHASADGIVIRDALSLAVVRVLAFWEAFPGSSGQVSCLSVDSGMKLIAASMGSRIAAWSLSGVDQNAWRLHSTLVFPVGHEVTSMDSKSGLLAVGSTYGLSVYTLILENDLPTWSQKWIISCAGNPRDLHIQDNQSLRIYSTTSGRLTQNISHPRPITDFSWRQPEASSRDDLILYTITTDSTLRIFLPVLDSPEHLQLHASLDLFSSIPFSITGKMPASSSIFWLDRQMVDRCLSVASDESNAQENPRIRRMKEIKDEGWDLFLRIVDDGSAVITAVAASLSSPPPGLDLKFPEHRPATANALKATGRPANSPGTFPSAPKHLHLLPGTKPDSLTLVTLSPLRTYQFSPSSFFDADPEGLLSLSAAPEWRNAEESRILRFVRTPDGSGVGVIRETGGEAWNLGQNHGLQRAVQWGAADQVVVLDGVVSTPGDELTIWDSKESEFATGLEYHCVYKESINDLDWSSTPDAQSILAVGFLHRVELLCQQRSTYFDQAIGWLKCWTIDIGSFIPYQISDSIWLANGSLLVGAGHQMFLFGQRQIGEEGLFEYVARRNGPLEDYHPQMLLQCLIWDKVELVKDIIFNLAQDLEGSTDENTRQSVPIERFLRKEAKNAPNGAHKKQYTFLFNGPEPKDEEEDGFNRTLVDRLMKALEKKPLQHLTRNENAHLLGLIQTTLEIDEQRRALDSNGLRYLISMRESQDLLLSASAAACNNKMCWADARALGVALWLNSVENLRSQMEIVARNEFMAGDNRDPVACSLFYFALGKVKLVHGLWRQSAWHKEQGAMLKFLSNDFTEPRWRTAALKNAFALLGKQRFEYAAAFFLLGGALQDAINVCLKHLRDFQLAVALARIVEQSNEGPVLHKILEETVIPTAFQEGNRWLACWGFWLLHRRDLAVRILLTPLHDIAESLDIKDIGQANYDDPSLALLFSQLRSKTLQAASGTSQISGRVEFNFVLQMARVFCRMGMLSSTRTGSRPVVAIRPSVHREEPTDCETSYICTWSQPTPPVIDCDRHGDPVLPGTRPGSPVRPTLMSSVIVEEPSNDKEDLTAKKAGLGKLMKSAKQNVTVPEFNMDAFF
ncbi:unnamed protein product [Mycena citricolor]|uniref:RAVE complex protein Rav1 C-terminal domain-containing protein n=1 Tax=Mycena citricolor TaxID=2018698 RepID=A0AAD2K5P8_9AGAR|nr:unnamed protein product [Mycena citricolor]